MVLGTEILRSLIQSERLIENLSQRDKERAEGAGFDLRVGKIYRIKKGARLGIEERTRPELELVAQYVEEKKEETFKICPGECYIIQTVEKVKIPGYLTASITPRHTLYGSGILLGAGNVAPGYEGELSFAVFNASTEDFSLALGSRAFFIEFRVVLGGVNPYKGHWQNGNVQAKENEKQI